jgi:ferrochelatase
MKRDQTAIVLFNLGGPDNLASVEPFLINLFSDREIIELPLGAALQPVFARVIAKMRGPSVRRNYARIGGGSPQLRLTMSQASALEDRLNAGIPDRYRVFIAMRYSRPTCEDTIAAIAASGIRRIVTLTLFPQYSKATTGSSRREFERIIVRPVWDALGFDVTHIDRYGADAGYLDAMAERVQEAWNRIPEPRRANAVILFSAHGLPQRFIDAGDPYVQEIEATRRGILERVALPCRDVLAYQSRTGPVKWIGPGTDETLHALGGAGVDDVLVVPLSFVSDHIETLYEVDLLFRDVAARAGITGYYRSEALNSSPRFIGALADLVRTHVDARACGCEGCGECDAARQPFALAAV